MPQIAVLADYQNVCGEGPIWTPEKGMLEWIDFDQEFLRLAWASHGHCLVKQDFVIDAFRRNRPGGYAITKNHGFWLWNGDDGLKLIPAEADGCKCQLNDCVADPLGRMLAGSYLHNPESS